jgi:MFS-type transporter involved in bile tolerance (Atg22 family)
LRSIINAEAIFIMVIAMRLGGIIDQPASRRKVKLYET